MTDNQIIQDNRSARRTIPIRARKHILVSSGKRRRAAAGEGRIIVRKAIQRHVRASVASGSRSRKIDAVDGGGSAGPTVGIRQHASGGNIGVTGDGDRSVPSDRCGLGFQTGCE